MSDLMFFGLGVLLFFVADVYRAARGRLDKE